MEFSEIEIKMFRQAREVQEGWKPQIGDWFYKADGLGQGSWLICMVTGQTLWCAGERMKGPVFKNRLVEFRVPENYVWIPSVERLQEMINDLNFTIVPHATSSANFKLLFLGLVMRERYQRKWNGKSWRKLPAPKTK